MIACSCPVEMMAIPLNFLEIISFNLVFVDLDRRIWIFYPIMMTLNIKIILFCMLCNVGIYDAMSMCFE